MAVVNVDDFLLRPDFDTSRHRLVARQILAKGDSACAGNRASPSALSSCSDSRGAQMSQQSPQLSVVIPAYNEEKRLDRTLGRMRDYFAQTPLAHDGIEIIVVNDGSTDRTTDVVHRWMNDLPCLRLIENAGNRGKGYSVRHGILEARGVVALFTDADLSSPIEESQKLLAAIDSGSDVAIGSRGVDRSMIVVHQSALRELAGIIFNRLVKLFTGLPFQDTQCGFKAFSRERTRIIFEQQRIEGFGFDPEILFLAERHGLRSVEVPVHWAHDAATRVRVFTDSLRMFTDLLRIRWNTLLGRYPRRGKQSPNNL